MSEAAAAQSMVVEVGSDLQNIPDDAEPEAPDDEFEKDSANDLNPKEQVRVKEIEIYWFHECVSE